jgi:phage tail-like protein
MAEFSVNTFRFDPYKGFKFLVKWDGRYVAGISKCSPLKRSTTQVTHREGGDPSTQRISPGLTKYDPITLERGITHDPEFEKWANLVHNVQGDALMSLKNFRKDIIIELLDEQGSIAKRWKVYRCWVSDYTALPQLDSNTAAVAIETMVLQTEGWERDTEVPEPTET